MSKISISVDDKRITDLLHGHGGGSSPWIQELTGTWNSKNGARVKFDREQDDEGDGKGRKTVRRAQVEKGLALFAKLAPNHFADWLTENDDEIAFDCAWQAIIFGKLVYG